EYENEERLEEKQEILKKLARSLTIYTRTGSSTIRYCDRCQVIKPDRCHHCFTCDKCVLKMDHHCPCLGDGYTCPARLVSTDAELDIVHHQTNVKW
ncbi:hypothetical protein QTP70_020052, partial [Hemibagrus guttatus]